MQFLLLFYAFCTQTSEIEGAWQRIETGTASVNAFDLLFFDSDGHVAIRGLHAYDGSYQLKDKLLTLTLMINEVEVTTKLSIELDAEQLTTRGKGGQESYLRVDRDFPNPLSNPQWSQRSSGHIKLKLPETWSFHPDTKPGDGYERVMVQSLNGLATVMFVRLPLAMVPNDLNFDFHAKDLFREFVDAIGPIDFAITEDVEGHLFGRAGTVFHASFDLDGHPVFANGWSPRAPHAYSLMIFTLAAHNEPTELRRIVNEAELIP